MDAKETQRRYRVEVRQKILAQARASVILAGYDNFSLRELAACIGYSPAAIYRHFKSKQEIFDALAAESFSELINALNNVGNVEGEDPVFRLRRGLRAYVDFGIERPDHYRLAFLLPASDVHPPKSRPAFESLQSRVEHCIAAGRFEDIDPTLATQALWVGVHGVTALLIQRPAFPWADRVKLIELVIESAIRGLMKPG